MEYNLDVGSDLDAIICGKSSIAGPVSAHVGHVMTWMLRSNGAKCATAWSRVDVFSSKAYTV